MSKLACKTSTHNFGPISVKGKEGHWNYFWNPVFEHIWKYRSQTGWQLPAAVRALAWKGQLLVRRRAHQTPPLSSWWKIWLTTRCQNWNKRPQSKSSPVSRRPIRNHLIGTYFFNMSNSHFRVSSFQMAERPQTNYYTRKYVYHYLAYSFTAFLIERSFLLRVLAAKTINLKFFNGC